MLIAIQPSVNGILAEFISALVIIVTGLYLEKHGLNRACVGLNVIGLIVIAVTTQLDLLVIPLLTVYLFFGILIFVFKVKWIYSLFGSKTYGSLLLAIAFIHIPDIQQQFNIMLSSSIPSEIFLEIFYGFLIIVWIMLAISAFILGKILD